MTDVSQEKYVRFHDDEWSTLYVDGQKVEEGDSYHSDERIAQILGVVDIYAEGFYKAFNSKGPAKLSQALLWDQDEMANPTLLAAVAKYRSLMGKIHTHSDMSMFLTSVDAPELAEFSSDDVYSELIRQRQSRS